MEKTDLRTVLPALFSSLFNPQFNTAVDLMLNGHGTEAMFLHDVAGSTIASGPLLTAKPIEVESISLVV